MSHRFGFTLLITFAFLLGLVACAPAQAEQASAATPGLADLSTATPAVLLTPTPLPGLVPADVFTQGSDFCVPEVEGSSFDAACDQNVLSVTQAADRLKIDGLLTRSVEVDTAQFSLQIDTTSQAAEKVKADQNAYGFYFLDEDGVYKALRVQGEYLNFETWSVSAQPELVDRLRPSFSPFIKSAGQVNHWRLACSSESCDIYVNDNLAGRSENAVNGKVTEIGLFTASSWDELFGQVTFSALTISDRDEAMPIFEPYSLSDDLTAESGTFSQIGMSGAFNSYQSDGFHFSPVISYGYYGAKAGPALQNTDVSVTVKMQIDPEKRGTQYAGLICRSSKDGMYMAVIGVDGTYTIYRDTPQKPFTMLAERKSAAIQSGLAENRLRLVCKGNNIDFYINDQQVEALTDTRYNLNFGRAGIFTKAGGDPNPDAIVFSDLTIKEIY
jgi:muconolactone delta-isomerase